jgi:hypothetical protein
MCDRLARDLVKHSPEDLELAVKIFKRGLQLASGSTKTASDVAKSTFTWLLMRKIPQDQAWQLSGMDELVSQAAKP